MYAAIDPVTSYIAETLHEVIVVVLILRTTKTARKHRDFEADFEAVTKRRNVSPLSTHCSPNSGSRNCTHVALARADTVRMA